MKTFNLPLILCPCPRRFVPAFIGALTFLGALQGSGQTGVVRIWTEASPQPNGPWTIIDPASLPIDASGAMVMPATGGSLFFRTQIAFGGEALRQEVPLADLPAEVIGFAQETLLMGKGRNGDPESWPDDAVLAPTAIPVYDGALEARTAPAFLEFKVIPSAATAPATAPLIRFGNEAAAADELGFILVALTDTEVPVPQFTTRGATLSEQLARLAGTPNFRMVRFGGDFWAAEDGQGNLLANHGAHPWKPDPNMVTQLQGDLLWEGDDDGRVNQEPEVPPFTVQFYPTYADFKADFRTNPVYLALRQRRANRARAEWQTARGVMPEAVTLSPGQSALLLPGKTVVQFYLDSEDEARLADLNAGGEGGGLTVTGVAPGDGILEVVEGLNLHRFAVRVTGGGVAGHGFQSKTATAAFTPGWQRVYEKFVGSYASQPRYAQMKHFEWDGFIGCGPNGWATLLAWWERERSNHLAFGANLYIDAPAEYYDGLPKGRLKPVIQQLRQISGGVYNPFDGSFATPPGSMPKSVLAVTHGPSLIGWLARSWKMRWSDFAQTLNGDGGAREVRDAIKDNYCALVGLGNYWHYAIAYGYTVDQYLAHEGGPVIATRRWLRCNMCWGPNTANAHWRDYYDVFFSSRLKLRVTSSAPPPQDPPHWH